MKKKFSKKSLGISFAAIALIAIAIAGSNSFLTASSHREAPLIANDPLADNTDLYAFRSPDDQNTVTIIANYIPAELPQGGPNYYSFGEDVRYEIHVKNNPATPGDDIIYRFEFSQTNQDPSTFFNIRLGQQNLKTTYNCWRSTNGGTSFQQIVTNGTVPPNNIGPHSISDPVVGLGAANYNAIRNAAIATATTGETIFCGPSDDPFFVDLGGVFDLGQTRAGNGSRDGLSCKNIHSICIKVPISTLQKDGKDVSQAANILDSDYIIGVWASASRKLITVRSLHGGKPYNFGQWVQVSRLGMPLTNEVIMPIGQKDYWNSLYPYNEDTALDKYFTNPELGLYMDDSQFGTAVPGLSALRIQRNSLQAFDFGNTHDGLAGLLGNPATTGTAFDQALFGNYLLRPGQPRSADLLPIFLTGVPNLAPYQLATGKNGNPLAAGKPFINNFLTTGTAFDQALFGNYLLRPGQPRSADLLPIFLTGVPNLAPYQLATGKNGNPLAAGKPFINNFLPTFGDMLRLNMAVPVTSRTDPKFSSLGLVQAAVLGLTDPAYNTTAALQFIPNMDGFPNGRRLEDDVTRIELQAVSGVVLSAIGLWYDDYTVGGANPVTTDLLNVLTLTTGVEANDKDFKNHFPYLANPSSGFGGCGGALTSNSNRLYPEQDASLKLATPEAFLTMYPNPANSSTTFKFRLQDAASVSIKILDETGKLLETPVSSKAFESGTHELNYSTTKLKSGIYFANIESNGNMVQSIRFSIAK